jgi:hypothetical protein
MLTGLTLFGVGSLILVFTDGQAWSSVVPAIFALLVAIPLFVGSVAQGTFTELHAEVFSHGYQVKNIVRQLGLSSSVAITTLAIHSLGQNPGLADGPVGILETLGGIGTNLPVLLLASKLVFAAMAASMIPLGAAVMGQRIFR